MTIDVHVKIDMCSYKKGRTKNERKFISSSNLGLKTRTWDPTQPVPSRMGLGRVRPSLIWAFKFVYNIKKMKRKKDEPSSSSHLIWIEVKINYLGPQNLALKPH